MPRLWRGGRGQRAVLEKMCVRERFISRLLSSFGSGSAILCTCSLALLRVRSHTAVANEMEMLSPCHRDSSIPASCTRTRNTVDEGVQPVGNGPNSIFFAQGPKGKPRAVRPHRLASVDFCHIYATPFSSKFPERGELHATYVPYVCVRFVSMFVHQLASKGA